MACSSLVADYGSEEEAEFEAPTTVLARVVDTSPEVVGLVSGRPEEVAVGTMVRNLPAAAVRAPVLGPAHPHRRGGVGSAEVAAIEEWSFHEQYHTFQSYGYALSASGGTEVVGTEEGLSRAVEAGEATITTMSPPRKPKRRRPVVEEDVGEESVHGVWAPEALAPEGPSESRRAEIAEALASERAKSSRREYDQNEDFDRRDERKLSHLLPPRHDRNTRAVVARSEFHGDREVDYQGRSWFEAPPGLRHRVGDEHDCFIPKKCIHTFTGHSKGVQAVRLLPGTGHLALSASMDGTCKIWDLYGDRRARRTYSGHAEAVRDANFSRDGSRFASTGFDRFVRVWDTETGACLNTLAPNRKMCFCVDFYPRDDHVLLAGASDNRIYQWDLRAAVHDDDDKGGGDAKIVQEYNHHLQPVNSVTFIDDDARFVSTSDDKKIFIWEYNIPVPMKYISEPHMNAVPVVEVHPSTQFWCGQSLDNQIVTYQARDKMKQLRKKNFRGHLCSGYAIGLAFSPNGRFLASGDAEGRVFVWDFKSTRSLRKWHAHDAACVGVQWHPIEPSWLVTCGWDGLIKLWD
ncbi:hypothetical protein CTAYLR_006636 [Chrysophaeum taylorii]|uniref:Pre-mRNA-processing factor 17 n=1 Tax=Chrysophaeum taylorii TaxID=2483200 RepID=A0AAD7ULT1_9STRA|nr:hypothetical protein CTAYLR_006636 [Chrysophaeum taylorii]